MLSLTNLSSEHALIGTLDTDLEMREEKLDTVTDGLTDNNNNTGTNNINMYSLLTTKTRAVEENHPRTKILAFFGKSFA